MIERGDTVSNEILKIALSKEQRYNKKKQNEKAFDLCIKHDICPNCGERLIYDCKPALVVHGVTEFVEYSYKCECGFKYKETH